MLSFLILLCASAVQAEIISNADLDNFVLGEILRNTVSEWIRLTFFCKKRLFLHQRSQLNEVGNWPEALVSENDINDRNLYKKASTRKKVYPLNLYRSRSFNYKERVEKRNNMNNNSKRVADEIWLFF